MAKLKPFITILLMIAIFSAPIVEAQAPRAKESEMITKSPRKHLATIVFSGLAGAILGLSTLSFYGRPQEKLANIPIGFAFGIITGAVYTTYKAASDPREFYSEMPAQPESWALMATPSRDINSTAPQAQWVFEF